jgi:hypothetical protein
MLDMRTLIGEFDMPDQDELKRWIESRCPLLWSLLNTKARRTFPGGLIKYIDLGSSSEIKNGRNNLMSLEVCLAELKTLCGWKTVSDNYRRDLSGVDSVDRVAELCCEIALCASLGRISGRLQLHPPTGKGTYSDCCFYVNDFEIYGEAKRYVDPWPHIEKPSEVLNEKVPYIRSITEKASRHDPYNTARARSMDLRSKLRDVYRQFPDKTLNILFIFHSSVSGETQKFITQTLLGDSNFFRTQDNFVLEADGLFSIDEWRNISACCLAYANPDSEVIYLFAWENPLSLTEIPKRVLESLKLIA